MKFKTFLKGMWQGVKFVYPIAKKAAEAGVIRGTGGEILRRADLLTQIEREARSQRESL